MREKNYLKPLEGLINMAAIACGYGALGLSFLIGYEILARRFFSHSVQGVDEIGGYVLAITAAVGFASALLYRMHTRIDIAIGYFPKLVQAILNTVSAALFAGFAVFMLLRAWDSLQESISYTSRASTPLQTPLWIPQSLWVAGIALFALIACAMAVHSLWLLSHKRVDSVNNFYGPPSLQDEIEEQVSEAKRTLDKGTKHD